MNLLDGLLIALQPMHLLWALAGAALGTAVGVLPGVGPAMTVALLLPATFGLEPTSGMILLAGIYYGAMYGGSTTSILFNIPGESATIVTAIEGHAMTRSGRAGTALATAAVGSFVAGTIGTLLIATVGPTLAQLALRMGPAEQFALILLAFAMVTTVLGDQPWLGLASLALGLLIGAVGIDVQSGEARLTFGVPQLLDGIDIIVVAVAFFAVSESLYLAWTGDAAPAALGQGGAVKLTREGWKRSIPAWLRGTALGFPLGAIPAGGAELPTLLSYALEKRLSRHPDEWTPNGPGAIEGVAGPEAANNASAAGTLVPMLALGIPTTATAAVLLVALQQYGLQPGPLLFQNAGDLVWALLASLVVGNAMLLVLNLPLVHWWTRLASIRPAYLHAGILVLATVGTWTLHRSMVDLAVLASLGTLGFIWRVLGCPSVPVVIGAMLGPLAEQHLQRALVVANGDWGQVLRRPGTATLTALALAVAAGALVVRARAARRPA
ncbi:MAG: tripartite tricarboxylate transporter permease [Gemmatimonadetes bacterium]|nr:tripartite tricarboxylate transporter permease [Gemmatimonadota bacterium]